MSSKRSKAHHHKHHHHKHKHKREKMLATIQLVPLSLPFLKAFKDFWNDLLVSKPKYDELLMQDYSSNDQDIHPVSTRTTLGIDLYEARALIKATNQPKLTLKMLYLMFEQAVIKMPQYIEVKEIIEADVIACSTVSKHNRQNAIELEQEKRLLTSKCKFVQWENILNCTDPPRFFFQLYNALFKSTKRTNLVLLRLSALRGRIALGKWQPPEMKNPETEQKQHAREVKRQFAAFRSVIRKKERRLKFLKRGNNEKSSDNSDDSDNDNETNDNNKNGETEEQQQKKIEDSFFLTQQHPETDLFEDVDAPPQPPQAEEMYVKRCRQLGVLPSIRSRNAFVHGSSKISLPHYGLGSAGCDALCAGIALNRGLRSLDLTSNNIDSGAAITLARALLKRMQNERKLQILPHEKLEALNDGEKYEGEPAYSVPVTGLHPTLFELCLDDNEQIRSEGALAIFGICSALQELKSLKMKKNGIDGSLLSSYASKKISTEEHQGNVPMTHLRDRGSVGQHGRGHLHRHSHHAEATQRIRSPVCKAIESMIEKHASLTCLHLQNNHLGDCGATSIGAALAHNDVLQDLQLSWNTIGPNGCTALCHGLKKNRSISHLSLGWNALGDAGATAVAECMAVTRSIAHLDLRHNHVKSDGAMFLADGLRYNNGSCNTVDLSFNPLLSEGVAFIVCAKEECCVRHWGLQAVLQSSGQQGKSAGNRRKIHNRDMSGFYVLHLDDPYDHGIAECLRLRAERNQYAEWKSPTLSTSEMWTKRNPNLSTAGNSDKKNEGKGQKGKRKEKKGKRSLKDMNADEFFLFNGGACDIPFEGVIEFFFVDHQTIQTMKGNQSPLVHFSLDMKKNDDRGIMRTMIARSRKEPGDNIVGVKINGVLMNPPYDGHNHESQRKLSSLLDGHVDFGYSSTLMRHEQHWKLDLAVPSDNAIAHKLLERVFTAAIKNMQATNTKASASASASGIETESTSSNIISTANQETWVNTIHNGLSFSLQDWVIDFAKVTGSILSGENELLKSMEENTLKKEERTLVKHTSATNTWRVPTSGLIEFDSISSHPQLVMLTPHSFDLSKPADRVGLRDVWSRACCHEGQTLWNCKIDNNRLINLPETLLTHSEGEISLMKILPHRGILSLDFITLKHNEKSRWMKRYNFSFAFFKEDEEEMEKAEKTEEQEEANDGRKEGKEEGKEGKEGKETEGDKQEYLKKRRPPRNVRHRQGLIHREKATAIFERTKAGRGMFEFCLNIEVNGIHIPQSQLSEFELPMEGSTLRFEIASYIMNHPIPHKSFLSVCENLAQQSGAAQRKAFLECLVEDFNDTSYSHLYLSADQIEILLMTVHDPKERWQMLQILAPRIVDPVNCVLGVYDLLMQRKNKRFLLRWIRREVTTLSHEREREKAAGAVAEAATAAAASTAVSHLKNKKKEEEVHVHVPQVKASLPLNKKKKKKEPRRKGRNRRK